MFGSLKSTLFIGKTLVCLPSCHSTNDFLLEIAREPAPVNGMVVITPEQTKGRGQRGNRWISEPGKNLTFSILLDASFLNPQHLFNLNMGISLGIIKGLDALPDHSIKADQCKIKWPNDIYAGNQKLGGILIETVIRGNTNQFAVTGIGININQLNFQYLNATSLQNITGAGYKLDEVLETICISIEKQYMEMQHFNYQKLKAGYLACLYKFNESNIFRSGDEVFEGEIFDVDEEGRMGIRMANGHTRYFGLKEVSYNSFT